MDALSHFSYYGLLGYNFGINRVEYQVNLDTRILSPLIVKLNAMNYNHVNELNLNLSYPFINNRTDLVFDVSGILQEDNKGYKLDANIDKYFLEGNLSLNIGLAGYADPISSVGLIRAYNQSMEYSQAEIFSLEYTRNLLKIEKGLWNPSIYFHDLYGKLFLDGMRLDQENINYSYGLEFHLTKQIGSFYAPVLKSSYLRLARNNQGETHIKYGFNLPF